MSVVGGEMSTPDRIKYIQGKIRIAIQNHQVLWQRLIFNPKDAEVEQMLKMLQDIILSLGRRQTELMYQYNRDIRLKYPDDKETQKKIALQELGWPDRDDPIKKHLPNGSATDSGKKLSAQLVKKIPNIQLLRPGQKMTSLLKPPVGNATQLQRKESERLKAAAAKQAETLAKTAVPAKHKIVLKVDAPRRLRDDKLSDSDSFPELKESELAGYKLTPLDKATEVAELSQDQYLECFGLVHKDKRKLMVVSKTKRKRRSAAGHSDFYKDYFQPKRPYNRKTTMDSPSSSQEIAEADSAELLVSEKPSVPPSPESSCSTEVLDVSTREGSPTAEVEKEEEAGEEASEETKIDDAAGSADPEEVAENADEPLSEPSQLETPATEQPLEPSKLDESDDDKLPNSVTPSPTNEDDSTLSPSDLIESYTSTVDAPEKENVDSVGDQNPVDVSAMIGGNVQCVSADGADCSEMVNRYLHSDNSDESSEEVVDGITETASPE